MSVTPLKVVFFGTPAFAVPSLRAVLQGPDEVLAVVTQPDRPAGRRRRLVAPPVKQLAVDRGLEVLQPERLRDIREPLQRLAPDLAIVVAYGKIFRSWMLSLPRLGCLNVHASVLPRLRGAAPIQWAVIRGERSTGVSIMRLARGVDTGPVCLARPMEIGPRETSEVLAERLAELGAHTLVDALAQVRAGTAEFVEQDETKATHAPMLTRESGRIDWAATAQSVDSLVRGLTPWPRAWTGPEDALLKVLSTDLVEATGRVPGEVFDAGAGDPAVACGAGAVVLRSVQPAGKAAMSGASARNGRYLVVGHRLVGDVSR